MIDIKHYKSKNTLMELNDTWKTSEIISKIWHIENSINNSKSF